MAIRGAGASGDGPGGLKTGVLRQFKVGSTGRAEGPPPTSNLAMFGRDFEVMECKNGSKWVDLSSQRTGKQTIPDETGSVSGKKLNPSFPSHFFCFPDQSEINSKIVTYREPPGKYILM